MGMTGTGCQTGCLTAVGAVFLLFGLGALGAAEHYAVLAQAAAVLRDVRQGLVADSLCTHTTPPPSTDNAQHSATTTR
jgi:hypothetical protein